MRQVLPARECTQHERGAPNKQHPIHLKGELGFVGDAGRNNVAGDGGGVPGAEAAPGGLLTSAFQALMHGREQHCSVGGVDVPPVTDTTFLGIENFFWTARAVGLGEAPTLDELRGAGEAHCARSWGSLHEAFAGHVPDQFIARYCFGAVRFLGFWCCCVAVAVLGSGLTLALFHNA